MKNKLGVYFTCFDELEATRVSIFYLKRVYPGIPIRLFYEGNINFKFLETETMNLLATKEEDHLSVALKGKVDAFHPGAVKRATLDVINRLNSAIPFLNSDYILMLDPDALVRGQLTIPDGVALLGSRINVNQGQLDKLNQVLLKYGGKPIDKWGATPCVFNAFKFLQAMEILNKYPTILDEMCAAFYAMFAHDVLLPSIFSLIGESETFNPDIVECNRNPNWVNTNCPLVHQFTEYYPKRATKYGSGNLA